MDKIINKKAIFVDLGYQKYAHPIGDLITPCLTHNLFNFYCFRMKRYINIKECLKLQGFNPNFNINIPKTYVFRQIGNTMSVNVLTYLFKSIFQTIQLI
jgi:site-specific DNA-cytosine methylase